MNISTKTKIAKPLLAVLFAGCIKLCAQHVSVYKLNNLLARIHNNSDTTYVVNFWATWCKPCVAELPAFEQFRQSQQGKPVKVLLVSIDFKEDLHSKLIPFLKKNKYSSEVVLLDEVNGNAFINEVSPQWTGAIPATLITSRNKSCAAFLEKKVTLEALETETAAISTCLRKR